MKKKYVSKDISGKKNNWYWGNGNGFHDAKILSTEHTEYAYDYREQNPIRNRLTILLELVGIEKICLYNYTILKNCNLIGNWWLCDMLSFENNKYILTITVEDAEDNRKKYTFCVKFDTAERTIVNS